jgi:hypothetical protein
MIGLDRTAMPHGAGGMPETDATPLVFDQQGILTGWGRDLLSGKIKRHASLERMAVFAEKAIR